MTPNSKVSERLGADLIRVQRENEHIRRIATLLVRHDTDACINTIIVRECATALGADAVCLFLRQADDQYEMVAEVGCTPRFKSEWHRIPKDWLPLLLKENPHDSLFLGTPDEFKNAAKVREDLVDQSQKQAIAYAPLVVNQNPIGVLGFSYIQLPTQPVDQNFVTTLVNLSAQAIERVRLFEKERKARQDAEEASHAKTNFLANISHEIRTPLTAINGFADLIASSASLTPEQKEWTDRIIKNTRHLTTLIGDILDISKIEAETVEVNRCFFALSELIDDVRSATIVKAREKGLALNFDAPTAISIHSDPAHLRQILINLISNSIKFTLQGGIDVRFEILGKENDEKALKIEVHDTGVGIPADDQAHLFEPFTQGKHPGFLFGGTGLGLYISKRLAAALNGELRLVNSTPQSGTSFCLTLECKVAQIIERKENRLHPRPDLDGFKILVAEDSLDNRYLLSHVLTDQGAEVDMVENGRDAVEKARQKNYDVIIMDIQMPVMDGNEATQELRSCGMTVPVIALTACALASEREKSLKCGVDDYLTKPIDFTKLIQTLKRLRIKVPMQQLSL